MHEPDYYLERRAYLALQGARGSAGKVGDWRNDVAAVLRSASPLSQEFREALASAVDGDLNFLGEGFRLDLVAPGSLKKQRQDLYGGVIARQEWMEIGRWMQDCIDGGLTRARAIESAADRFPISEKKSDAALSYFHRVLAWTRSLRESGNALCELMDDEALFSLFHQNHASGKPLDCGTPIAPETE